MLNKKAILPLSEVEGILYSAPIKTINLLIFQHFSVFIFKGITQPMMLRQGTHTATYNTLSQRPLFSPY